MKVLEKKLTWILYNDMMHHTYFHASNKKEIEAAKKRMFYNLKQLLSINSLKIYL